MKSLVQLLIVDLRLEIINPSIVEKPLVQITLPPSLNSHADRSTLALRLLETSF